MNYPLYKGNKSNSGGLASFQLSPDKKSFWVQMVKQFSWDANSPKQNKASFRENVKNPEKSIRIKLNVLELGGIVAALKSWGNWSNFHTYNKDGQEIKTQIKLSVWKREGNAKGDAMSFGISQGEKKFVIALEKEEVEVVRILIESAIVKILESGEVEQE